MLDFLLPEVIRLRSWAAKQVSNLKGPGLKCHFSSYCSLYIGKGWETKPPKIFTTKQKCSRTHHCPHQSQLLSLWKNHQWSSLSCRPLPQVNQQHVHCLLLKLLAFLDLPVQFRSPVSLPSPFNASLAYAISLSAEFGPSD